MTRGWFQTTELVTLPQCRSLVTWAHELRAHDAFQQAGIVTEQGREEDLTVRKEWIYWLDPLEPPASDYFTAMELLREGLNRRLMLGLWQLEAHLAWFPPAGYYHRHLDQTDAEDARVLSCTLYLNEGWQPDHGGALRLYNEEGHLDISPEIGRLVGFWSKSTAHEVLVSHQPRLSITGWFRLRPLDGPVPR